MSYLIISNDQNYKIAHLIEAFKTHQQVEIIPENTKKKIKPDQVLYNLKTNDIKNFLNSLDTLVPNIDTTLLWEMVEEQQKISINEFAKLYFGDNYTEIEITALLFALSKKSIEFINHNDGSFTKCTVEEQIKRKQILAKQTAEQELFQSYYSKLIELKDPEFPNSIDIMKLINKPDKHSIEYKALTQSSKDLKISPLELMHKVKLIKDIPSYFINTFISENFTKGVNYNFKPTSTGAPKLEDNPNLDVFSIDDLTTTEIDDAFSVSSAENQYTIGIHISAPAIDESLENMAVENISTIYFPEDKITMLPEAIIDQYSLYENTTRPVVSIYFVVDLDFNVIEYYSKIENIKINKNLRIQDLEIWFNQDLLDKIHNYPYEEELKVLYNFAKHLEELRGKPSVNNLAVDYNFTLNNDKVIITPRIRGNPIDKLVSELMILANCTWGRMLTNSFIPAIYRVKQPNYPVKMTLHADSHTGLNVSYYTWATSPLRRASDYINQHQIISMVTKNKNFYTATSHPLLNVVETFDKKYSKYLEFQNKMERYWSLKYLIQESINELDGIFIYKSKVQLSNIPIEIDTSGLINPKPKGSRINVKILNINLTTLQFDFKIIGELQE